MFVTMVTIQARLQYIRAEIARDAVANGWFKPVFTMAIKLKSGQI